MNDDEMEEIWQTHATPRAKLLRDVAALIAVGDPEVLAARATCIEAWHRYKAILGTYEATKAIPDVSWFEVHAAMTSEVATHMVLSAAEDRLVAIAARRNRQALQHHTDESKP